MRNLIIIATALSAFALSCNDEKKTDNTTVSTDTVATTKAADEPYVPVDSATMMKNRQAFMTPGEPHKMLAKNSGSWSEELTMWMTPDAPPQKMTTTSQNKMILNGLYQQSIHKGSLNGMPFEGISTTGYDNIKKMFVSTWIDNMGSGIIYLEGPWDEATKSVNYKGTQSDVMTNKTIEVRQVWKIIDDNTHMLEMYETRGGKENKTMEIKSIKK